MVRGWWLVVGGWLVGGCGWVGGVIFFPTTHRLKAVLDVGQLVPLVVVVGVGVELAVRVAVVFRHIQGERAEEHWEDGGLG